MTNILDAIAKSANKSKSIVLFEFMKNTHPITFKRMLKNEQLIKTGKMINCSERVHSYVELQDNKLVEVSLPEEIRQLQDKYFK